jgi:hypothetical protein
MSPAPSSAPAPRKPSLPSFLGGRRPPGHTLVPSRSLRRLHRLLLLSLLGQLVTIGLVVGAGKQPTLLRPHLAPVSPAGPGAAGGHPGAAPDAPPYAEEGP